MKERTLIINGKSYKLKLLDKNWEGALNQSYFAYFELESYEGENLQLTVGIFDLVLMMWGYKNKIDELDSFFLQIIPSLVEQLFQYEKIAKVYIHRDENVKRKEDIFYIQAKTTIGETAKAIVFDSETPSNSIIRREIIKICYATWQANPHDRVNKVELLKLIPVEDVDIERNLQYLSDSGYISASLSTAGYNHIKLTNYGIDLFENPEEFNKAFSLRIEQQTINVSGDYITPTIIGSNNNVIVKSKIENAFNDVIREAENSNSLKKEELELITQLKNECLQEEPSTGNIQRLWDKIKKLPNNVNDKILKHPIISKVIAETLLNHISN